MSDIVIRPFAVGLFFDFLDILGERFAHNFGFRLPRLRGDSIYRGRRARIQPNTQGAHSTLRIVYYALYYNIAIGRAMLPSDTSRDVSTMS